MKKFLMCLSVVLLASTVVSANGLLGYWDFEGNANDVSGYGAAANATLYGGASLVTAAGRNCLSAVNGGAMVLPNSANGNEKWDDIRGFAAKQIPSGTERGSGITLSVWVKPNNVEEQWKFLFGMSTGWGARMFSMNSGAIADCQDSDDGWNPVSVWAGTDWSGGVPGGASLAWHNVIFTYDYTVQEDRLYIDGVLRSTSNKGAAFTGWWAASTDALGIGTDNGTNGYNGLIDDAAIFSGSADLADAQALYSGTATPYTVDIASTPEPMTMSLLALGSLVLARRNRK